MPKQYIDSEAEVADTALVEDSEIHEDVIVHRDADIRGSVIYPGVEIGIGAVVAFARVSIESRVLEYAKLRGERNHPIGIGQSCIVGPHVDVARGVRVGLSVPPDAVSHVINYRPEWAYHDESSIIGESSRIGRDANINDTRMEQECEVGTESIVAGCTLGRKVKVGSLVLLLNCRVGNHTQIGRRSVLYDVKKIESDVVVGEFVLVKKQALIASGCRIGSNVILGMHAAIRPYVRIGDGTVVGERAKIGTYSGGRDSTVIGEQCRIGHRVKINDGVVIETGVSVGEDAVIEHGAHIGSGARIGAAYVVSEGERVPPNAQLTGERTTFAKESHVVLAPTAESFVYFRLAEVAGDGRLTKDKLKRERPELLEHPLAKDALRARPRPTAAELNQLAEQALRGIRYQVTVTPGGWRGGQRLGRRASDLITFSVTDEMLDAAVAHMREDPARQWSLDEASAAKSNILLVLTGYNIHFSPRTVAWVRLQVYCEHGAVVIEEIQTDITPLRLLMGDPSRIDEAIEVADSVKRNPISKFCDLPWEDLRPGQQSVIIMQYMEVHGVNEVIEAHMNDQEAIRADARRWYGEWCQAWRNFFMATHDIYEVMLSTVLDMAAGRIETSLMDQCDIDSVYLLTYDTKTKIRDAGRPPVYPYSKLYKLFQSARKVELPEWVDTSGFDRVETRSSDPWRRPRVPQARLLRPNE